MSDYEQSKRGAALDFLAYTVRCSTNEEIRIQAAAAILAGTKSEPAQQTERDPVAAFLDLLTATERVARIRVIVKRQHNGPGFEAFTTCGHFQCVAESPIGAISGLHATIVEIKAAEGST